MLYYSVFTSHVQYLFKNLMILIGIETCSWKSWSLINDNYQNVYSLIIAKLEATYYEVLALLHKLKNVCKI